jgi:hypothetical protein
MAHSDYEDGISRNRVCGADIARLWETHDRKMDSSRDRIRACRATKYGERGFILPPEFNVPGAEFLSISLPQKTTVPLKTINVLSRKQPRLQRHPIGTTLRAELMASNIETWVNAAIEKKVKWGEVIGKLFDDGECAIIVIPSLAHWEKAPDFMDSLSYEEFCRLDPETQDRYCRVDENDDPILDEDEEETVGRKDMNPSKYVRVDKYGHPQINPRYMRDKQGRAPDDQYYENSKKKFKEHRKTSKKAFEEEQAHWLSEELPFRISVISATECAPIFDTDDELVGLVVRRNFNKEALIKRDYVWDEDSDLLEEVSEDEETGEVTLYEYWGTDRDGIPFVSYSVNGKDTRFRAEDDDEADAIIDLREEFGIRKLPVLYAWGLHFETDDYKMRGVPFLWPVLGAITGVEALSTSILVHSYSTAFGSWGVAADPQIVRDHPEVLMDGTKPRNFNFAPLTTTILPGRPYPLVHPGVGKDVKDLLNMLMTASASMAPSETAFGGGQAASGHDRALSREYLETSMNQVLDGALKAYQFIAERILEICCGITKLTGVPVPVYATVPTPQSTGEKNRSQLRKQILELRPEWVGPIYNLVAFYPKSAGENLAELQQLSQLLLQGLVTFREFREKGFGDENPAATLIEIYTDQYLKSDAGKAEVAQLAAELMGADSDAEKQRLMEEKRLTSGGTPIEALPPELQALNTGKIPPGVDPELFLTKLQGMMAHDAARASLKATGPLGGGPPAPPMDLAGMPPQLAGPGANIPPAMTPPGAPGPAGPAPGGMNEQAPMLPGMNAPSPVTSELGGIISGQMGTASRNRDMGV